MSGRSWTKEELEILKQYYRDSSSKELELLLPNRSPASVKATAMRLFASTNDLCYKKTLEASYKDRKLRQIDSKTQQLFNQHCSSFKNASSLYLHLKTIDPYINKNTIKNLWEKTFFKKEILQSTTSPLVIGEKYGIWTIKEVDSKQKKNIYYLCECEKCKNLKSINSTHIRQRSKGCDCDKAERRKQTFLERYNQKNASNVEEFKQLRKETNLAKYGSENYLKTEDYKKKTKITIESRPSNYKEKMTQKQLETRTKTGEIQVLSNGEVLSQFVKRHGIKYANAKTIFNKYGEEVFLEYCKNYQYKVSSDELLLMQLMKEDFPDIEHYNKKPIEDRTINYKPDFRFTNNETTIYINVDGLYTHSEASWNTRISENKRYHLEQRESFEKSNLTILQFRTNEIETKPQIVRSMILARLGMLKNKIPARKTQFEKLDKNEANLFFNENHLMGTNSKASSFGLKVKGDLVAAISVRYFDDSKTLEIVRFCSKNFLVVQGGFSKLLSKVIEIYNPSGVLSYCDLRYANGASYTELGFEQISTSLGWNWTDYKSVFNRLRCRANMDSRNLSEKEHSEELGLYKIYDAGQSKYIKRLKSDYKITQKTRDRELPTDEKRYRAWSADETENLINAIVSAKSASIIALKIELKPEFPNRSTRELVKKMEELGRISPERLLKNYGYYRTLEPFAKNTRIKVRCICGTEKEVLISKLMQGVAKSCGCQRSKLCSKPKIKSRSRSSGENQ